MSSVSTAEVEGQQGDGASLRRLLLILRRRWRLLAIAWIFTLAGTALVTFSATPLYMPMASIEIRPETPMVSTAGQDPWILAGLWEQYYRTQQAKLSTDTLMKSVLEQLPAPIKAEYGKFSDPAGALAGQVVVERVRDSFLLNVGIVDKDPEKACQIVNTIAKVYVEEVSRELRGVKREAVGELSSKALPDVLLRLDETNKKLDQFNARNGYIDLEKRYESVIEEWSAINKRLSDLKSARIRLRREIEAFEKSAPDGLDGVFNPELARTPSLEKLLHERSRVVEELAREGQALRNTHPRMERLRRELAAVEGELRQLIEGSLKAKKNELLKVEGEEQDYAGEQERQVKEIERVGMARGEYRKLSTELLTNKELHAAYLKQYGDAMATAETGLANVRVMSFAKPPEVPFKPRVSTNLAMGAAVGLLLGLLAMFLADQLDNRVLSAEEVEAFVELDVLSVVPKLVASPQGGDKPVLLDAESGLGDFETFRHLRAEVMTRLEKVPNGKVVAVLSAMDREGKTTVAVNLARSLAMEGRRVLVVDADMRRPALRPNFAAAGGAGLEDVLAGKARLQDAIRPSRIPGVDVVGAMTGTGSAAELAGSPAFEAAIRAGRESYDMVIIDSPPLNLVAEAALIARRADASVLVIREGQTARGAARMAKRRLEAMGVKLLGAVLNCAAGRGGGYGYGYGYGYYYSHQGTK